VELDTSVAECCSAPKLGSGTGLKMWLAAIET
jgi:hypothetical protein